MSKADVRSPVRARHQIHDSRFLRDLARVRNSVIEWAFGESVELRPLRDSEIEQLKAQGNYAEDWKVIRVHPEFGPERVWQCRFLGSVVLGPCRGALRVHDVPLPTGVYRATLRDAVIGADVLIQDVTLVDRAVIGRRAAVVGTNFVLGQATRFANGIKLCLGVTTGARLVPVYAECLFADLADVLHGKILQAEWESTVRAYADGCLLECTVIGPGARVLGCGTVRAVWLDGGVSLTGTAEVTEATILGESDRPAILGPGVTVRRALVQWGAQVSDGAIVENAVIGEAASVGRYARVRQSVIGPNASCYQAEVTSSVVGPFTGINHDALLIAALWEGGKGNLSAGARVGSNHTGKAPDQESHVGEGTFFGLGVSVKYPCSFRHAPYTLIASGVTVLPQQLAYPFSLVVQPKRRPDGVAEGYNELYPAWVLYAAPYSIVRNEGKYAARNRARYNTVDTRVLREDTVRLMAAARARLQELLKQGGEYFTDAHDPGIGKNFVTREACSLAIDAYADWIRLWVLRELWGQLCTRQGPVEDDVREHEFLAWAVGEGYFAPDVYENGGVRRLLDELVRLENAVAVTVEQSKSRDFRRAARIQPGYDQLVPLPPEDTVVRACWERVRKLEKAVADFLREYD